MKTLQIILVSTFLLLSINTISAQYGGYGGGGYGGGYGGGGYGGGMNRGMNRDMNQESHQEKPKEIPVEVTVAKIIDEMKTEINLDELQTIAISNVLTESIRTQGILLKQVASQEDQIKDFKALSETTDRKIMEFLNEDQKPKYLAFKEDRKNQKKSRSGRKHKDETK
ncbi:MULTISPECIES: hypothetical protein [unclassified Flavobacterium]|jgi:hypothetical protein|uniref:hypothetical protein n=1 Tax=unclassified Flavobacterium TaxID=196869 RepID=UPI0025BE97BC|nr:MULTISPECIES: hypothetical protein [unclassified Flavobacterium]